MIKTESATKLITVFKLLLCIEMSLISCWGGRAGVNSLNTNIY